MTLEEVAAYLRVSERTIYEWAQKGKIPGGKLGTSWRFRREDLEHWISEQLTAPTSPLKESHAPVLLQKLIHENNVLVVDSITKDELLYRLIDIVAEQPAVGSKAELTEGIFQREKLMSTGIGLGIAIPHVRLASIKELSMACAVVHNGVPDYITMDDLPVKLIFMIVANESQHAKHLQTVAQLSKRLKDQQQRELLCSARNATEFCQLFFNRSTVTGN